MSLYESFLFVYCLFVYREQIIVVPDITGGALCPRLSDPPSSLSSSRPSSPASSLAPPLPEEEPSCELTSHDDITQGDEGGPEGEDEGGVGDLPDEEDDNNGDDVDDDEDDDDEELAAACRDDHHHKRLSMESGYSPSEKHVEDDVVAVEMREQQLQPALLDQSELPSERLSLPSSQTDGKLANRDSGIDSISSPSHSEELCFAGVDDGGVAYQCSPALLPRLSSSSSYAGEGGEGEGEEGDPRAGARRRREFSEEGDSDLEEEEVELTLVLAPPKTDRQDSAEVRIQVV